MTLMGRPSCSCHFSRTVPRRRIARRVHAPLPPPHVGACRLALVWPCASRPTQTAAWAPDSTHVASSHWMICCRACRVMPLEARLVRMRCTDSAMLSQLPQRRGRQHHPCSRTSPTTPSPASCARRGCPGTKSIQKVRQLLADVILTDSPSCQLFQSAHSSLSIFSGSGKRSAGLRQLSPLSRMQPRLAGLVTPFALTSPLFG